MNNRDRVPIIKDSLIKRISKSDVEAFKELYRLANPAVFGLALSLLGNRSDADDVSQEVFTTVFQKANQYKGGGKAMAWLFTITRNYSLMKIRDNKKRSHYNLDDLYDIGVENKIEQRIHYEDLVIKLLSILKEDDKQIVIMHSMSNMKHKEIAKFMNMPLSTVLSKYKRAMKKMKDEMEVKGYEK